MPKGDAKQEIKPFEIVPMMLPTKGTRMIHPAIMDLVDELLKKEKGTYKVTLEGVTNKALNRTLRKIVVRRKLPLKIIARKDEVFVEKY